MNRWLFLIALLLAWLAAPREGDCADLKEVIRLHLGVNGAWFDGPTTSVPNDYEVGANASASLSPHLSAVGGAYYGVSNVYVRWSAGARVTVTDVDNPNFSVGLGAQYHGGDDDEILPEEWMADASFGWRPFPNVMHRLVVVGQAGHGLSTSRARATLGLRYSIPF